VPTSLPDAMVFARPTSFVATQKGPLKTHHVFSCPVGEISHITTLLGLGRRYKLEWVGIFIYIVHFHKYIYEAIYYQEA